MRITKLLLCMLAVLSMQGLFAKCSVFDGFYVGVAGGEATNFSRLRARDAVLFNVGAVPTFASARNFKNRIYEISGIGEIFAGYGCVWRGCNFCGAYFGLRVGGNFSSFRLKKRYPQAIATEAVFGEVLTLTAAGAQDLRIRSRLNTGEFTLDAKPGILLTDRTMLYGLLGVALNRPRARFRDTFAVAGTFGSVPFAATVAVSDSDKGRWAHFRWGVGLEQMLTACLSINAQFTYTDYGRLRLASSSIVTLPFGNLALASRATVRNIRQTITLGLSYYF